MTYLEESDLIVGKTYSCQEYFSAANRIELRYLGNGVFADSDNVVYLLRGDIRYVFPLQSNKEPQ